MPCSTNTKKEDLHTRNEVCVAPGREPMGELQRVKEAAFRLQRGQTNLIKPYSQLLTNISPNF